jgi:hypothetical protein
MPAKPHGKPVPVAVKSATRWEMCPACEQVRVKGKRWKRACVQDKRVSRYMGS